MIIFAKMYPEIYRVRRVPETYNLYVSLVLHLIALKIYIHLYLVMPETYKSIIFQGMFL